MEACRRWGPPVAAGSVPWGAWFHPKGKFVYVTNYQSDNVSAYTINVASGG